MRIRVICQGKTKNEHLRALQSDYQSRIAHFADLTVEELPGVRPSKSRGAERLSIAERKFLEKPPGNRRVMLDERGREWSSTEFAEWMAECGLRGMRELTFLMGGTDGFSAAFREEADVLLALSRMTLTRDWARTLLLEQIYRGFTIQHGYPYPR